MKHKFNAIQTIRDGFRFDSKLEAKYYDKLVKEREDGLIVFFLRQVPFHLPGNVRYVCDFVEYRADGTVVFVDVKGMDTAISKLKRKQVEALYPVKIKLVTKV